MPLISVVVPVYNAQKYLKRCISSILQQDFDDYELLLVNDGSKDDSGKICDELSKIDSRIKVIHKNNGGASSARNVGLANAQGEYILFVDSDDYVREGFFSRVAEMSQCADMIIFGILFHFSDKEIKLIPSDNIKEYQLNEFLSNDAFFLYKSSLTSSCARAFKREIIVENDLQFDTTMTFAEDSLFNIHYVAHCDTVCMDNDYYYICDKTNENSITHRFIPNQVESRMKYITEADALFSAHMGKKNYKKFVEISLQDCVSSITYAFQWFENREDRLSVIRQLSNFQFLHYASSKHNPWKQRLIIFLLKYHMTALVYVIFDIAI